MPRWFGQTEPGMVRIDKKAYVRLLEQATRAYRLEERARALNLETARLEAKAAVSDFEGPADLVTSVPSLPLTEDGHLHEEAFGALVQVELWRRRDEALRTMIDAASVVD